jgi:Protein of unknown function (DUF3631)
LVSGFQKGIGYSDSKRERNLFAPKAFAGIGTLPEPIADRSLPIILDPLHGESKVQRFNAIQAQEQASPIMEQLQNWAREHLPALEAMRAYPRDKFPPGLSPRKQDMFEPLLQLADALGGIWPELARKSLMGIFDDQAVRENRDALKLLDDIREAYVHYGRPHRLSTAAMIAYLRTLPNRGYNQEEPINDRALARMLASFQIRSRSLRFKSPSESTSPHRGYLVQDFVPVWARLLGPESPVNNDGSMRFNLYPGTEAEAKFFCEALERKQLAALERSQHEAERKQLVAAQKLEKAKEKARVSAGPDRSRSGKELSSGSERSNTNKDAACSSVATSPQDRLFGEWEGMTEEQRAILAEVRRMQNSLPACAEREMQRIAPPFLRR